MTNRAPAPAENPMGTRSMLLTLLRQAVLPLVLAWAASLTGRAWFVWGSFILAELLTLPVGIRLWKKSTAALPSGGDDPTPARRD